MLILSRGIGDRIVIGEDIVLTVVRIRVHRVQIGLEAPVEVSIRRVEMLGTDQPEAPHRELLSNPR